MGYRWSAQLLERHFYQPASPIASNYPLNEQWAPLAVYGKRAPNSARTAFAWAHGLKLIGSSPWPLTQTVVTSGCQ